MQHLLLHSPKDFQKDCSHRGNFHPVRKTNALKPSGMLNEDLRKRAALHAKLIRRAGGKHST
jgi:hypothetical protein